MLRLNYLNKDGNLVYRPLRNCDLHTSPDVFSAAKNAKWAFQREHPELAQSSQFYRKLVDWLLSPVSPSYNPNAEES